MICSKSFAPLARPEPEAHIKCMLGAAVLAVSAFQLGAPAWDQSQCPCSYEACKLCLAQMLDTVPFHLGGTMSSYLRMQLYGLL